MRACNACGSVKVRKKGEDYTCKRCGASGKRGGFQHLHTKIADVRPDRGSEISPGGFRIMPAGNKHS